MWQPETPRTLDERRAFGSIKRGEKIYAASCVSCHGVRGKAGPNIGIGNPEFLTRVSAGFLRHAIRYGRAGTAMAGFDSTLGEQGVEDVVALLRSWERPVGEKPRADITRPPPLPLGPVPLNPKGPEPRGFKQHPGRTSIDVIKPELDRGARMALLDARAPSAYMNEHIPGAVSVPFYDPKPYFDKLPRDAWLVAYCACPHAESRTLAALLVEAGFKKVTILDEGLREWRKRKYPTTKGTKP